MNEKILEILAAKVHTQWSCWMKYLFAQGKFQEDGSWTMEKWAVDRWLRQSSARYEDLSEDEKESDRGEVEIYLGGLVKGNNLATLLEENLRLAKENEELKTPNKWNQQYCTKEDMCPLCARK